MFKATYNVMSNGEKNKVSSEDALSLIRYIYILRKMLACICNHIQYKITDCDVFEIIIFAFKCYRRCLFAHTLYQITNWDRLCGISIL